MYCYIQQLISKQINNKAILTTRYGTITKAQNGMALFYKINTFISPSECKVITLDL